MMEEVWQPINNFPNYSVSNLGNVMNNKTNKQLKQTIGKDGYYKLNLYNDIGRKTFRVNILVCMMFLDYSTEYVCDHINGNKLDNNLSNLRVVTQQQNCLNRNKSDNKSSQFKGVCYNKSKNYWQSQIRRNRKLKWIGCYSTEKEARNKYIQFMQDNNLINEFTKI